MDRVSTVTGDQVNQSSWCATSNPGLLSLLASAGGSMSISFRVRNNTEWVCFTRCLQRDQCSSSPCSHGTGNLSRLHKVNRYC